MNKRTERNQISTRSGPFQSHWTAYLFIDHTVGFLPCLHLSSHHLQEEAGFSPCLAPPAYPQGSRSCDEPGFCSAFSYPCPPYPCHARRDRVHDRGRDEHRACEGYESGHDRGEEVEIFCRGAIA